MGLSRPGAVKAGLYLLGSVFSLVLASMAVSLVCLADGSFQCSLPNAGVFRWVAYPLVFGFFAAGLYHISMFLRYAFAMRLPRRSFKSPQMIFEIGAALLLASIQAASLAAATWFLFTTNTHTTPWIAPVTLGWLAVACSISVACVPNTKDYEKKKMLSDQEKPPIHFPGENDTPHIQRPIHQDRSPQTQPPPTNFATPQINTAVSETGFTEIGGSSYLSPPKPKSYSHLAQADPNSENSSQSPAYTPVLEDIATPTVTTPPHNPEQTAASPPMDPAATTEMARLYPAEPSESSEPDLKFFRDNALSILESQQQ